MHCDDRDDMIMRSTESFRAISLRTRMGSLSAGAPVVVGRERESSAKSREIGASVSTPHPAGRGVSSTPLPATPTVNDATQSVELSSVIMRAVSRRGVRSESFQTKVSPLQYVTSSSMASASKEDLGDSNEMVAASKLAQEADDAAVEDAEANAHGDDTVDVHAALRMGLLLIFTRLLICPALLFGLFALCRAGAVPVLAPSNGDAVLSLLVLVEACAPSAQSVLLLCQMTGQVRAAKTLSIVFLVMYPVSLITMTFWISVAMALVFG